MTLSDNTEKHSSTDIDLQFVNSPLLPDLKIGVTFAFFILSGKSPRDFNSLKIFISGCFMKLYTVF